MTFKQIADGIILDLMLQPVEAWVWDNGWQSAGTCDRFKNISKEEFEAKKNAIFSTLGDTSTETEFISAISRAFALLKDAHTIFAKHKVQPQEEEQYNCTFKIVGGDVFIINEKKTIARKVTAVNGILVENLVTAFATLAPYEVEPRRVLQVEKALGNSRSYELIGAENRYGKDLVIDCEGKTFNVGRRITPAEADKNSFKVTAERILYIDYNTCSVDKYFIKAMQKAVGRDAPKGVIIDLRKNNGGSTEAVQSVIEYLRNFSLNETNTAVLMCAETFSSGIIAAKDLRDAFNARFIGEPPGQPAASYGDVKFNEIEGYKFTSTQKYFDMSASFGASGQINPDILVPQTFENYLLDEDPQYDKAIEYLTGVPKPQQDDLDVRRRQFRLAEIMSDKLNQF